jgi:uncharacterized protein (TIGR02611 family)
MTARRLDMMELYKKVRRLVIAVLGFTVLLIGVAMTITPAPSLLVIVLGLAILATEFIWARRLLNQIKGQIRDKALRSVRWFKRRFR